MNQISISSNAVRLYTVQLQITFFSNIHHTYRSFHIHCTLELASDIIDPFKAIDLSISMVICLNLKN